MKYFLDYSEDAVVPLSADDDLVKQYEKVMAENDTPICVFDTKEGMLLEALEWAHQAREGCYDYEHIERDDMIEMINDAS